MTLSQSSTESFRSVLSMLIPALLTSTSTLLNRSMAWSMSDCACSASDTSACTAIASPPASSIFATSSSAGPLLLEELTTTFAPPPASPPEIAGPRAPRDRPPAGLLDRCDQLIRGPLAARVVDHDLRPAGRQLL